MTSKPEGPGKEPGKDTGRSNEAAQQKRPHATLDLKATEIRPSETKTGAQTATASPEAPAAAKPDSAAKAAPAAAPKPADARKTDAVPQASTPTGSRSLGVGRAAGYVLASMAGGVLALGGSHWLQRAQIDPARRAIEDRANTLEARILALEQGKEIASPVNPELQARLDEAGQRLAKLETMSAQFEQLSSAQAQLANEAKDLGAKIANANIDDATAERLKRLEGQLATLSAAAGNEDEKGRIPQLAAITGRIADLEGKLDGQLAALRKSIPDEVSQRISTVAEASEAARTGSQRLDREMQAVKTDVVRLGQRAEELKAGQERVTQTLEVLKEDQGRLASTLDGLKASVESQLKSVARPADVAAAIAPVAGKLSGLETNLESVVKNEADRRADAERIVVALELANLKRALDSGAGYTAELEAVRKAAGGKVDLAVLDKYQAGGLPTMALLESEFRSLAFAVIEADSVPADAGVLDRLMAGARSVVRVRKVSHSPDDKSTEAIVARMEQALKEGRLGDALALAKSISDKAAGRLSEWRVKAEARHAVDKAIAGLEQQLKTSLGGALSPAAAPSAAPAAGSN
jgi:hypothetical protein